jgi:hypothetical protein
MDSSENEHALRRSSRLPLEVPVLLTSLDPGLNFSERCNTTLVNAHGCGLISPLGLKQGVRVRLEIVSAKRHTTARVAEVVPLGGEPETWLVGLELDVPGNFWGIEYAPADWKIEEVSGPIRDHHPADREWGATAKTPQRRWHLTDISVGACYLESASPLPAETPVILSIRDSEQECLLEGIVRVSHPQTGMGVEFARLPGHDQRGRVEDLIGRLVASRDVPKIFVGRKETSGKDAGRPNSNSASAALAENEVPDPLLDLVRTGSPLSVEQFLSDLRAQRLGKRRDPRINLALRVLLSGTDVSGRPLDQRVMTINISRRGALMEGVHGMLKLGDEIFLSRVRKREQFRVAWVGAEGTPVEGQIGVAAVDPNSTFWDEVLEASASSGLEATSIRGRGGAADD